MKQLLTKYRANYRSEEMHFEFQHNEVDFEVLVDFRTWKHTAFHDGMEKIVIFYKTDLNG
jgi:hypothetical protein